MMHEADENVTPPLTPVERATIVVLLLSLLLIIGFLVFIATSVMPVAEI